jgi:allantoinase
MSTARLAIKSTRILQDDDFVSGVVLIDGEIIVAVVTDDKYAHAAELGGYQLLDVGNKVVMPGLVDCHVHVNEPGRTEWEGFNTATRAAAAGGITTITDMPLNCIPVTTTVEAFDEKLRHLEDRLWVNVSFWGGVVPGNTDQLHRMVDNGVMGFKCFLIHSGIDDFPNVERADLEAAMPILAARDVPLLVHAELDCGDPPHQAHIDEPRTYAHFLASRPRKWENDAIDLMIDLCRKYKCRVHIVHLSSSDAVDAVRKAKAEGLPITTESCPHYLTLAAEDIADGDTRFKCAPPIRERENQDKLWQALEDGTIDFIVSDHSPCTPELKHIEAGDFHKAWGGIASLQFGLPAIWTEAQKRGHGLGRVSKWMSANTADFIGLSGRKGAIAAGFDADIVVFDPDEQFVVTRDIIEHRHKVTPHEGRHFSGRVLRTFVGGREVYLFNQTADDKFIGPPSGKTLLHTKQGERVNANVHS